MGKTLVVVESPAKAKTIKKYLGTAYEVLAWQGSVQFGDATAALPRLSDLAGLSPRAATADLP